MTTNNSGPVEIKGTITYQPRRQIGIGQGMNSEVWEVYDPQLGGNLAVKQIPRDQLVTNGFRDWFRESRALFATGQHRNVVPVQYACDCPGQTFVAIAMPLYSKGSLEDRISVNPLPLSQVKDIAIGVLAGLHSVHLAKLVHLDIKPSNILFSDEDVPMLADFGQAKYLSRLTGTTSLQEMYPDGLPPEFFEGAVGSLQTDIYLMGITLYRAVNGNPFFRKQIPTHANEYPEKVKRGLFPNRSLFLPHVPDSFRKIIRKALHPKAGSRHVSAVELQDSVAGIQIKCDWSTAAKADGTCVWTGTRQGKATLIIEHAIEQGHHCIRQYKMSNRVKTKMNEASWVLASRKFNEIQAQECLRELFRALE